MNVNTTYTQANNLVKLSWYTWGQKDYTLSLTQSTASRALYFADVISNLVQFPFAIIGVTYGFCHAVCTWNWKSPPYQKTKNYIIERTNHILISAFGAAISPGIAHKYQDLNLAPIVIAARIAVVSYAALHYFVL